MLGLMQDRQLLISNLLEHAALNHADREIVSCPIEGGEHRYTYAECSDRTKQLAKALLKMGVEPGDRVATLAWNTWRHFELFFAIRNPATFMPALLAKTNFNTIEDIFRGYDPFSFRWSELFERIRAQVPDIPITVWCNEDTPLIWAEVVREMAALEPTVGFEGEFSLLAEIMTEAGMKRFRAYVAERPGMSEIQKRRVISAFLDKFADDEAVEEEYDIEGWTADKIDRLTDLYEEDIYAIQRVPGVTMISP